MRLVSCVPASVLLASLLTTACHDESAEQQPRAAALRWQQRADEHGRIPEGALYREAAALKERIATEPLATGPANWTLLGPGNIGGRIRSILIHPTNPIIMWVGSVSGGVWKTIDAGASWTMLPDLPAVLAVTCMVLDPADSNTIYAGTGEQCFFDAVEGSSNSAANVGAGVFKSVDGGDNWIQLSSTAVPAWNAVSRLSIDRNNSQILLASTISGIWRTTNGGVSWTQHTTVKALDVEIDPSNSSRCIAGRADGFAQYSTNGGVTWNNTAQFAGSARVEVTYARATPGTVYAAVSSSSGSLTVWRSTDNGQTYIRQSGNVVSVLGNYTSAIWVNPTNSNMVVAGGLDVYRSTNAGVNFTKVSAWASYPASSAHADHHIIVEHPQFNGTTNNTVYFGNDGGIQRANNITTVANLTGWTNLANGLAITQLYGCCINSNGVVLAGAQDNGTVRGTPAQGLNGWTSPLGGDGSFCVADPTDPNYIYTQYYYLNLYRSTNAGSSSGPSIKGAINEPSANFMAYIRLDPNDANRMYACGAALWRTSNVKTGSPPTWTTIKPPLSCPSSLPEKPRPAHFADNPPCNISTVEVARGNPDVIWVGHNNGAVYFTTNGLAGAPTWTKVDDNATALPNRWVSRIVIDPNDHNKVTVSFMGFTANNVWRTTNAGTSWSPRSGSGSTALPAVPVSCITQHRVIGARFYAATDLGLFYTEDDGLSWRPAVGGPSIVPMDELVWRNDRTMVVATHGRSVWTCDVDPATVTPVGTGCGTPLASLASTAPLIGGSATLTLANAAANAPVALLLAAGPPSPTPIGPCVIQPALGGLVSLSIGSSNGVGGLVTNLPIPGNGALVGGVLTVQEFIVVAGGPLFGVGTLSNGVRLTLGF